MDFGSAASDYARHRRGFPPSFFDRVPLDSPLADLGSGTGSVARGYRERGAFAVALDLSLPMLAAAQGLEARVAARAEALPFGAASFASIVAGQCWHWFDGPTAARECNRALRPRGRLVIAHFDYLLPPGGVAAATEALILEYNPAWPLAGIAGNVELYEKSWRPQLERAGFGEIGSFHYQEDVVYSQEDWRGRIRACNGVIALRDPGRIAAFDGRLRDVLRERFDDPLVVPHRVIVFSAVKAG